VTTLPWSSNLVSSLSHVAAVAMIATVTIAMSFHHWYSMCALLLLLLDGSSDSEDDWMTW
jgi:hypothetical protein